MTLSGIVIEVRLLQLLKVDLSILVTPSGMVIEVMLTHRVKASTPMLVMLSGMEIEVRLVQPKKALSPILVTGSPSISAGISKSPSAASSQSVIVTPASWLS